MESPKKIAFVSWHNYLDQTNGASISTRAILKALSQRNWRVQTFCNDHHAFATLWGCKKNSYGAYTIGGEQKTKFIYNVSLGPDWLPL